MCLSPNITYFNDTCNQTLPGQKWILLNPFDQSHSNEIIDTIKNNPDMNVTGLIFETNQIISTNQSYSYPQIISEVAYSEAAEF